VRSEWSEICRKHPVTGLGRRPSTNRITNTRMGKLGRYLQKRKDFQLEVELKMLYSTCSVSPRSTTVPPKGGGQGRAIIFEIRRRPFHNTSRVVGIISPFTKMTTRRWQDGIR
jgi:hypothetical protein